MVDLYRNFSNYSIRIRAGEVMAFVRFGGSPKRKIGINPDTEMGNFFDSLCHSSDYKDQLCFTGKFV